MFCWLTSIIKVWDRLNISLALMVKDVSEMWVSYTRPQNSDIILILVLIIKLIKHHTQWLQKRCCGKTSYKSCSLSTITQSQSYESQTANRVTDMMSNIHKTTWKCFNTLPSSSKTQNIFTCEFNDWTNTGLFLTSLDGF